MSAGKLTTIVAIDIAGYSALSQADEEAAIAAVARLGARCAQSAGEHGGRIFNKAGDSVMMEFGSVAAGLQSAAELAINPDPPIRVGVHLGEVSELPNGDLLGHGVNVAARIQAQARPGRVLVSEDARRALRGPLARRLMSKGVIKLDKIDEHIGVYELTNEDHAVGRVDGRQRDARRWRSAAIAAIAAAAVVVLAVFVWPMFTTQPSPRVAVFSPAAANSETEALANGVADDIALALTAIGVETVARSETASVSQAERLERARALGAQLAVEGRIEASDGAVRLTMNVIRTTDRTTLWSEAFEGTPRDLRVLRGQAAEMSADVLVCAVRVMRIERAKIESATLGLMLYGCAERRRNERLMDLRDSMMRVIARDPGIPYARALLALSSAMVAEEAPETMRPELLESARTEAGRAIREAPNIGESYLALSLIEPSENWDAREQLLRRAVERDELNGTTHNFYATFLAEVGREAEALAYTQRAVALDPLSGPKRRYLAYQLALNERHEEARTLLDQMAAVWTEDPQVWRARLRVALSSGASNEASALLDGPVARGQPSENVECWRHALRASREAPATGLAFQRVIECGETQRLPGDVIDKLLIAVGDLDGAFARGDALSAEALFAPQTAALRRDPRFMALMRDLGLLAYWRLSGHWPDFCREPNLPYRCQAEAQRLL